MLDLKDLQCLDALARHRHFARAARECGVSQPAFSMRISKLEERLKAPIVKRGNRFQGFTDQGAAIVHHARAVLDEMNRLEQEFRSANGEVTGAIRLGVIPTALGYAGQLAIALHRACPKVTVRIETATSLAVQQGIEDRRFDAGLTYTDGAAQDLMRVEPLYDEGYALLAPGTLLPEEARQISWAAAATLPLCLLEPGMQNRRILDAVFDSVGALPKVIAETSGFTPAIVMVAEGMAATVLPDTLVETVGAVPGARALPLVDPVEQRSVSLVTARRGPELPSVAALRSVALVAR